MPNLVPEKRMDRNGVMVTRHVKTVTAKAAPLLPAPTAGIAVSGTGPTVAQTKVWKLKLDRNAFPMCKDLYEVLSSKQDSIKIKSNDVNTYAMLSMLSPEDTLALMEHGIDTVEKARAFMKEHNLQDLEIDRKEFAAEAIRRRIPVRDYLAMCEKTITRNAEPANVLDAAEIFGMKPLTKYPTFYLDVMAGDINANDIRDIGPALIADHPHPNDVREALLGMKKGENKLDSRQAKLIMEWSVNEGAPIDNFIDVANVCGFEKLFAITNIEAASSMANHVSNSNKFGDDPEEKFARVVQYEQMAIACDAMPTTNSSIGWRSMPYDVATEMYEAGIEPKAAAECWRDKISAAQYLAIKEHGIAPSVSGGWL
jgi:hypothetical protein